MLLRTFRNEDAAVICGWIDTEEALYKWSADRFGKFPFFGDDMIGNYAPQIETSRFFPLTAENEDGQIMGHMVIRFPKEDDPDTVRFGFVIVDPALQGKGYGKEMLRLGIAYAGDHLHAKKAELGVFENNARARRCYEALGFKAFSEREYDLPAGVWRCVDMSLGIGENVPHRKESDPQ